MTRSTGVGRGHYPRTPEGCANMGAARSRWCAEHPGAHNSRWQGGISPDGAGYLKVQLPTGQRPRLHRHIMEQALGRPLLPTEVVHHIDGDRINNDPSNLAIMTQSEHASLHQALKGGQA